MLPTAGPEIREEIHHEIIIKDQKNTGDEIKEETLDDEEEYFETVCSNPTLTDKTHSEHNHKIENLLCDALCSLPLFFNPHHNQQNQKIPFQLINEAKALIFLRIKKGRIGIHARGNGILICKLQQNSVDQNVENTNQNIVAQWSSPCAIYLKGLAFGFNIGIETINIVMFLIDESVLPLILKNKEITLGKDCAIIQGPYASNDDHYEHSKEVNQNKLNNIPNIIAYAVCGDKFVDIALKNEIIACQDTYNKQFYDAQIDPASIVIGNIKISTNQDYNLICQILYEYYQSNGNNVSVFSSRQYQIVK